MVRTGPAALVAAPTGVGGAPCSGSGAFPQPGNKLQLSSPPASQPHEKQAQDIMQTSAPSDPDPVSSVTHDALPWVQHYGRSPTLCTPGAFFPLPPESSPL